MRGQCRQWGNCLVERALVEDEDPARAACPARTVGHLDHGTVRHQRAHGHVQLSCAGRMSLRRDTRRAAADVFGSPHGDAMLLAGSGVSRISKTSLAAAAPSALAWN